jgi:hypothetical protein
VKECPECATAVAEARGFIAASSRILTALDNAPRGVIPTARPRKRFDPLVWRIAASLLVVAAGTLVVVRNREAGGRADAAAADSLAPMRPGASASTVPVTSRVGSGQAVVPAPKVFDLPAQRQAAVAPKKVEDRLAPAVPAAPAAPATLAPMAMVPLASPAAGAAGAAARDRAFGAAPLRIVATPRRIGAKVTLYEVDGDTVTLTESGPPLESVVVTGLSARQATEKAAAQPKRMAAAAAPAAAPDTQERRVAPAPPAPAVVGGQAESNSLATINGQAMNVITWSDAKTGATLTLTGRIPSARLEQLKIRIERERAEAAARKEP